MTWMTFLKESLTTITGATSIPPPDREGRGGSLRVFGHHETGICLGGDFVHPQQGLRPAVGRIGFVSGLLVDSL
jgi:hypothetical protein